MNRRMGRGRRSGAVSLAALTAPLMGVFVAPPGRAEAALSYWDADGSTPGAGGATPSGTWGVSSFWSPSAAGTSNTAAWTDADTAVFSAGTNAVGAFTVTVSGSQTAGSIIFEEGAVTLTGGQLITPAVSVAAPTISATINSSIATTAGLAKNGPGTLVLGGANSYSGGTVINAGTLRIGASGAIPTGNITVAGGQLALNGFTPAATNLTFGNGASTTAAIVSGPGTVLLSGDITFNGNPDTTTPSARIAGNVQLSAGNHTLANVDDNLSDSFYDLVVSGSVSGAGELTKSGSFFVVLSAANTYSGATHVDEGVLLLGVANAIPAQSAVSIAPGAELWLFTPFAAPGVAVGSFNQSIGSLSGGGGVSLQTATLTVGNNNANTTFFGSIQEAGSLTKVGSGTLTLNGANTYSGPTTVNAGKLLLGSSLTSSSDVIVQGGGVLELQANSGAILATDTLTISGAARVDLQTNKLILALDDIGTWTGSAYDGVSGLIQAGRNGGNWSGSGLVTSQTDATSGIRTSIGVATAAQVKGVAVNATALWAGRTVTGSDTLVMYTYGGDANLDGKIDVLDYGRIDLNVPLGTSGWFNGDFNYDGTIDVLDYGIIDFNIAVQGAPFPASIDPAGVVEISTVPEPTLATLLCCAVVQAARRRRHCTLPLKA